VQEEYAIYAAMEKLSGEERDALQLKALQEGKISTRRLFVGDRRGVKDGAAYDDAGITKNRWGRDGVKLYVDYDNKPHLEVYDQLGKSIVYDLKLPNQALMAARPCKPKPGNDASRVSYLISPAPCAGGNKTGPSGVSNLRCKDRFNRLRSILGSSGAALNNVHTTSASIY